MPKSSFGTRRERDQALTTLRQLGITDLTRLRKWVRKDPPPSSTEREAVAFNAMAVFEDLAAVQRICRLGN